MREWLGAMVTGGVVDYDPAAGTYALPAEHAAWLTRAAGTDNLAVQAQFIPLLAQVEQPLIDCFRNGGGVPYAAYPRFQQLMAEDSGAIHDAALIDTILPLVPGLPARLAAGIDVADVGCGQRARHQPDGARLPHQPLRRLRLLRGGHPVRDATRRNAWA